MGAEERTKSAITLTREILLRGLDDLATIVLITINDLPPEVIEDKIYEILEYLDKTKPKENESQ